MILLYERIYVSCITIQNIKSYAFINMILIEKYKNECPFEN